MAIFSSAVQTTAVTQTAAAVFARNASGLSGTITNPEVQNVGPNIIYLGQSGVTSSTGLEVQVGASCVLPGYSHLTTDATGDIYAICASGKTATVIAGPGSVVSNV